MLKVMDKHKSNQEVVDEDPRCMLEETDDARPSYCCTFNHYILDKKGVAHNKGTHSRVLTSREDAVGWLASKSLNNPIDGTNEMKSIGEQNGSVSEEAGES